MNLWCQHRNQTSPRRDNEGEYCRCLDCGARIAWSWPEDSPSLRPPRLVQPSARPALGQRLVVVWNVKEISLR